MPRSDGYKNLRPNSERTREELRSMTRNGGIASGKKRREQKEARECMKALFSYALTDAQADMTTLLNMIGVKNCERNQRMALLTSMLVQGQMGNAKAAELSLKVAGEMPAEKQEITGANGAPLMTEATITFNGVTAEQANDLIDKAFANEAANAES